MGFIKAASHSKQVEETIPARTLFFEHSLVMLFLISAINIVFDENNENWESKTYDLHS